MKDKTLVRSIGVRSDNPKSAIQNPKWAGLALAVAFALCGAVADAQQAGKIFRIGFLDVSSASGMVVLVDAFRGELSKLGWIEAKTLPSSTDLLSKIISACLILLRSWFFLGSI
jgi:hypothetical protein